MSGLLEAVAALAISAAVMALVTVSLTGAARIQAAASTLAGELFAARQLEHLVDRAALAAGSGPAHPAPVPSLDGSNVVFASDQNGDGAVDSTSSETTALEVRHVAGTARVRVRLGRQTMTVLEAGDSDATLEALDRGGGSANAASATLVALTVRAEGADSVERRMLFSVPARTIP